MCNAIASIQTEMCPEKVTDDQNNKDFVGPLLGPLSQILTIESHDLCMFIMR